MYKVQGSSSSHAVKKGGDGVNWMAERLPFQVLSQERGGQEKKKGKERLSGGGRHHQKGEGITRRKELSTEEVCQRGTSTRGYVWKGRKNGAFS